MRNNKHYIPVAGTWGRRYRLIDGRPWHRRGSSFFQRMKDCGWSRVEQDRDPLLPDNGYWSGDLGGVLIQSMYEWFAQSLSAHPPVWAAGGDALAALLAKRQYEWDGKELVVIAHSHGGQVAALAFAAFRPEINLRLITVDMPVRRDMYPVYAQAAEQIAHWTHLHSRFFNPVRLVGSRCGPCRNPFANLNIEVPGGHSGILNTPRYLHHIPNILRST